MNSSPDTPRYSHSPADVAFLREAGIEPAAIAATPPEAVAQFVAQLRSRETDTNVAKPLNEVFVARGRVLGFTDAQITADPGSVWERILVTPAEFFEAKEPAEVQRVAANFDSVSAEIFPDHFRLTADARAKLKAASASVLDASLANLMLSVVEATAAEISTAGAADDLRKYPAFVSAFSHVAPEGLTPPVRTLEKALASEEIGFAGRVRQKVRVAADALMLEAGLDENEKLSVYANAAWSVLLEGTSGRFLRDACADIPHAARWRLRGKVAPDAFDILFAALSDDWSEHLTTGWRLVLSAVAKSGLAGARGSTAEALKTAIGSWVTVAGDQSSWAAGRNSWDESDVLWEWQRKPYTLRHASAGIIAFGETGSGKTSGPGEYGMRAFLRAGYGMLAFCVKADERDRIEAIARAEGRGNDLKVVSLGKPSVHNTGCSSHASERLGFNFLRYLQQQAKDRSGGAGVAGTADVLEVIKQAVEVTGGSMSGGRGTNQVFFDQMLDCLRASVNLLLFSDEPLSFNTLKSVMSCYARGEPDPAWYRTSLQWFLIEKMVRRLQAGILSRRSVTVVENTKRHFLIDMPRHDRPGTTSNFLQQCLGEFTAIASPVLNDEAINELFCGRVDWTPEETFGGKIVIIDVDFSSPYHGGPVRGRIAAAYCKVMFQRAVLARYEGHRRKSEMRPVVVYADEAQKVVDTRDADFTALARQWRCITFYLTQGYESIVKEFGERGQSAEHLSKALFQNFPTKIFLCTQDPETVKFFNDIVGQELRRLRNKGGRSRSREAGLPHEFSFRGAMNWSQGTETTQETAGWSEQYVQARMASEFLRLRNGGPRNDGLVDAIVVNTQTEFGTDGTGRPRKYATVTFRQVDQKTGTFPRGGNVVIRGGAGPAMASRRALSLFA